MRRVIGRRAAGGNPLPRQKGAAQRRARLSWAQRLKQVFAIEIEACAR